MPQNRDYAAIGGKKTGWCNAFPAPTSIPDAIWNNVTDHRQQYQGDHGIQFQPYDENGAQYAALLFEDEEAHA